MVQIKELLSFDFDTKNLLYVQLNHQHFTLFVATTLQMTIYTDLTLPYCIQVNTIKTTPTVGSQLYNKISVKFNVVYNFVNVLFFNQGITGILFF